MKRNDRDSELVLDAMGDAKRSRGGWWRVNCPFCMLTTGKADKRASLGIKPAIEFYACFKCGARGGVKGIDEGLIKKAKAELPPPAQVGKPDGYECLADHDVWESIFMTSPRTYLEERGLSKETIQGAKLGAAVHGKYAGRIIVPVFDVDGSTWLGFSARDWTNRQKLRYRYPPGMQRGRLLYNQAAIHVPTDRPLLVVEGVFDALPYWPDAVACLGKPGEHHRDILLDAARPIAVCLDGDAHEEGWALAQFLLLNDKTAGSVRLPPTEDPNSVDPQWLVAEARRCLV